METRGKVEVVVQNAESYQETLDRLERAEALAAIRRGILDFENGDALLLCFDNHNLIRL